MNEYHALLTLYNNELNCVPILYRMKWPSGFICPRCGHTSHYTVSTRRLPIYECRSCRHQASLTTGSVMEKSRTPIHKWLIAMHIIAASDEGINAVRLSELIKVTYKTAWSIMNKIRLAISDSDRAILLTGRIEAKQEVFMKQPHPTHDALLKERAAIVAQAHTKHSVKPYMKIKIIKSEQRSRSKLNRQAENEFLEEHVSSEHTSLEINRKHVNPPGDLALLPAMAKTAFQWLNDTFHGLSESRAQLYLDEFCFRYNHAGNTTCSPLESLLRLCISFSAVYQNRQQRKNEGFPRWNRDGRRLASNSNNH
ncbi:transposase [Paenibacillus sp. N4]|uniref:transposase n=1 Tax=Paenibacillus vietnamensis TaxID=2590547 RepID=UPI001CD15168|nr:transposase [Paenibacillus vietnamensis]MCA0756222.1 transposase [Paenibacillus vietnamensis]